jgi:hypothetical protein
LKTGGLKTRRLKALIRAVRLQIRPAIMRPNWLAIVRAMGYRVAWCI